MCLSPYEHPNYLKEAVESVFNQSLEPQELIIVKDGQPSKRLQAVLKKLELKFSKLIVLGYNENKGVAYARNVGLRKSKNEIVALMDSDDICRRDRFKIQYNFLKENKNIDVVSASIQEFYIYKKNKYLGRIRKFKTSDHNIILAMKKRNIINNVTTMFRKQKIISVGGHIQIDNYVDYYLWVRVLMAGYKISILEDVVVDVRTTHMFKKRGGLKYVISEIKFWRKMLEIKFISKRIFMISLLLRIPIRLLPNFIRSIIYNKIL